jgi:hypothetical protein
MKRPDAPSFFVLEAICAAEDPHKLEERDAWRRYDAACIALLTTKPRTMAGIIALLNYVALPECLTPGVSETILDRTRLSSNREASCCRTVLSPEFRGAPRNCGPNIAKAPQLPKFAKGPAVPPGSRSKPPPLCPATRFLPALGSSPLFA